MENKKCIVCGRKIENQYIFCFQCNRKKEQGIITKCSQCGRWHEKNTPCPFLYQLKPAIISNCENEYYEVLKEIVPENYLIFPQINLAVFIERTDHANWINEMFKNVDFLLTDSYYAPKLVIEINDKSHENPSRIERDEKVRNILEEAGIHLLTLWVKDGIDRQKIAFQINELLNQPVERINHSLNKKLNAAKQSEEKQVQRQSTFQEQKPSVQQQQPTSQQQNSSIQQPPAFQQRNPYAHQQPTFQEHESYTQQQSVPSTQKSEKGCYIATCVYGSYDCPSVWTLRRFRDDILDKNRFGRLFIKCYYTISPTLVKRFGNTKLFQWFWKNSLDKLVAYLNSKGIKNTKYKDKY